MLLTMRSPKNLQIKKIACENPCLCFNIRKASRVITQVYEAPLRSIGYTPGQLIILSALRELGSATINELADAVATDRTTLSRNLKPLTRDGLIGPCACHDRRTKIVRLLPKGEKILTQATLIWEDIHIRIIEIVGKSKLERLVKELKDFLARVDKMSR